MKVSLSFPFLTLKGKRGKSVYYHTKNSYCVTMREYVIPEPTINNTNFANKSANIGAFYKQVSPGYLYDLATYARSYNLEYMDPNCYYQTYSIYVRMMYALARLVTTVDLSTITPAQVVTEALPIITVAQAIDAGLLPKVPDYEYLDHTLI